MLLARYSNIDYVLKMKFKHAHKLIEKAIKEREKEDVLKVYLVDRQNQLYMYVNGLIKRNEIMSFPDYYDMVVKEKTEVDQRPANEILDDIMKLKFE